MAVDPAISLNIVRKEIDACKEDAIRYGWDISAIDEKNQTFRVKIKSPIDEEIYIVEIKFDNYKQLPPFIEFIDPKTEEKGTKNAYPSGKGNFGSFFHGLPCICHPCSRKAYKEAYEPGPHKDWSLSGWSTNPQVGLLTTIRAMLQAIYFRISNKEEYNGRMR